MENHGIVKTDEGHVYHYEKGILHRPIEDGPAVIYPSGRKEWYVNGELVHLLSASGDQEFYKQGRLHREDGPAVICANDTKKWYIDGKLHREDGPAITYPSGHKEYYKQGLLHREDGPAIIYADDTKDYYLNGQEVAAVFVEGTPEQKEIARTQYKMQLQQLRTDLQSSESFSQTIKTQIVNFRNKFFNSDKKNQNNSNIK